MALFGEKQSVLSKLARMATECGEEDWDGAGAEPLDRAAVGNAANFIRALPDSVPLPELAPEPDGGVSADWQPSRHRMISLSFGPRQRVAVAWLDGTNRGHAVEAFDGVEVSARLLGLIRGIVDDSNALVGAA